MPAKPLDAVGQYPGGPTGVRPLRHLSSQTDYNTAAAASQLPPQQSQRPATGHGAVYPAGVVLGQAQGFPAGGVVDCHGNPSAGGVYPAPASSCHQQPSPVSAPAFTAAPHNYPVSIALLRYDTVQLNSGMNIFPQIVLTSSYVLSNQSVT